MKAEKELPNPISCESRVIQETHLVDVKGDNEKENPHLDNVYSRCSAKGDSLEKDSACFMDKTVMVCYKDSTCNAVKDICVDEGATVHDKFLSQNGADGRKDLVKLEKVEMDFLSIPVKETDISEAEITEKDSAMPGPGDVQSSSGNDSDKCVSVQDQTLIEEFKNAAPGKTENEIHLESFTLGHFLSMEINENLSKGSSLELIEQSSQSLNPIKRFETVEDYNAVSESEKTNNGAFGNGDKNTLLMVPSPVSTSQEPVSESQISSSGHHELKNNRFEEDDIDSNLLHRGLGETSFAAAESVSGLITYSGPIAIAGSLSVRSDGSNTSARSFAFPVLASEWNSSPVRMARADKRHIRRQNGWKQTLFCCRF